MVPAHEPQPGNILRAELRNIGDVCSLIGVSAGVSKLLGGDFQLRKRALDHKLLGAVADKVDFAGDSSGQWD